MPIAILPEKVISQIAAGEVVERPASVIKELVENAVDAGARTVQIQLRDGGRRLMRVSDDGCGILSDEVSLAFARHATSKLRTIDDLMAIRTLGFRGEALSSIAAVSHLILVTRSADETVGTQVRIEGGTVVQQQSIGAPAGTIITVENLFYNTPARLKFLKKDSTEKRQISGVVTRYALAYPHIRFVLEQDSREIFRTSGSGQLADVVVTALGLDTFRQMIAVESEESTRGNHPAVGVYGYTSLPSLNRNDRSRIMIFVNGRAIQDSNLTFAVTQAYHGLMPSGRHPIAVLMLDLATDLVDVNVHPTKAEVRFQNPDAVFTAVQRAVRRAIVSAANAPDFASSMTSYDVDQWAAPGTRWLSQADDESAAGDAGYLADGMIDDDDDPTAIPVGPGAPSRPRTLPMLRVVGQVGATYIVAEGPVGLYLLDQHAAHHRILYEQFTEDLGGKQPLARQTVDGQTFDVPPREARLIEQYLDVLKRLGLTVEVFGTNTFIVRALPLILADADAVDVLASLMGELELRDSVESLADRLAIRLTAYAAVKSGQVLNMDEMQAIVRRLERSPTPLQSPDGHPTLIHMSNEQLAREFNRSR